MSRKRSYSPAKDNATIEKPDVEVTKAKFGFWERVFTGLLTLIGTAIVAYYGYQTIYVQTVTPINATQTAQAQQAMAYPSSIPPTNTPIVTTPTTSIITIPTTPTTQIITSADTPIPANTQDVSSRPLSRDPLYESCDILYEPFDDNNLGWRVSELKDESSTLNPEFVDGKYRHTVSYKVPWTSVVSVPDLSRKDFVFSADVTLIQSSGDARINILFRVTNDNWYRIVFSPKNGYLIELNKDENGKKARLINWSPPSQFIHFEPNRKNTIKVEFVGSKLSFYANDNLLGGVPLTDTRNNKEGGIAIGTNYGDTKSAGSITVDFDNICIASK